MVRGAPTAAQLGKGIAKASSSSELPAAVYRSLGASSPRASSSTSAAYRSLGASTSSSTTGRWLVKSEPSDYSIDALAREGTTVWDGVRNAQAQKHMKSMRVGDRCLFYHSSCAAIGVVGIAEVAREAYPEPGDASNKYVVVDLRFVSKLAHLVSLTALKADARLSGMVLLRQPRLSVQPVERAHFDIITGANAGGSSYFG